MNAAAKPTRFIGIDLLRGIAAFAVVLYHAQGFFRRNSSTSFWNGGIYDLGVEPIGELVAYLLFGFGFLGVPLFFVISGFCIHYPFAGSDRALELKSFARRRFVRLYPAYLAVCLIGFAFAVARDGFGTNHASLSNLFGHLVFWHYDYPIVPKGVEFTIVIWSIVIEVHFYIIYALLFGWLRRVGYGRATLLALGLGLIYRIGWSAAGLDDSNVVAILEPHRFAIARFGEWMVGAWIAEEYATGRLIQRRGFGWPGLAFGLAWIAASIGGVAGASSGQYTAEFPITLGFGWVLASLLSIEAAGGLKLSRLAESSAKSLGDRSYSLYLIHYLSIAFFGEVAARLLGITNKDAAGGSGLWGMITIGAIVVAVVAAEALYRGVERPSHQLARRSS